MSDRHPGPGGVEALSTEVLICMACHHSALLGAST